jgi:hypothetical protein
MHGAGQTFFQYRQTIKNTFNMFVLPSFNIKTLYDYIAEIHTILISKEIDFLEIAYYVVSEEN